MKYFSIETVVNAYKGFQDCMTNKSWGYLAILKGCQSSIRSLVPYEVNMNVVSNFLEDIFNLSQTKRSYDGGRSLYVVFSNKWDHYFNDQGRYSPNIFDVIVWAYRRKAFADNVTNSDLITIFAKEFNISLDIIANSFNTQAKTLDYTNSLYPESQLKSELSKIGVDVTRNNIDAKKGGVVAFPGEISRGPFVQTLYAGLDISDYVLILQSDYYSLYGKGKDVLEKDNNENGSLQQIFYGAPGTGKSHRIKEDECVKKAEENNLVFRTTFHPDSDYSTFVGAYKPTMQPVADKYKAVAGKDEEITYSFVPQAFLQAYVAAWNNPEENVFLVIEEINRGNCAQIFGDLFQLLDRDCEGFSEYPIMADNDLKKYLRGKDEEGKDVLTNKDGIKDSKLKLPKNLFIWATMNTSDQSLFPIDSAFKRRWDWVYVPIDTAKDTWYIKIGENYYSWTKFLNKVNDELLTDETAEDKHLGFYFCKTTEKKDGTEIDPNVITAETFVGKVLFYLWNDVFKVYGIPSRIGSSKDWSFRKFYQTNGEVDAEKVKELMKKLDITPEGGDENHEENSEDQ
jgi:hypothetical protein